MPAPFTPIAFLPDLYVNNMQFAWGSATTLTVAAGQARDSANNMDIVTSSTLTISTARSGALGLDTGTIAASTWYYIHVIADSSAFNLPSAMISTSATSPTLPTGYDSFRVIGTARTDGSSNLLKFWAAGSRNARAVTWDVLQVVGAALTATGPTTISVAVGVPPIAGTMATFWAALTTTVAGGTATFRVTGSTATTPLFNISADVNGLASSANFRFLTQVSGGNASIDYGLPILGQLALSVLGYELTL